MPSELYLYEALNAPVPPPPWLASLGVYIISHNFGEQKISTYDKPHYFKTYENLRFWETEEAKS